MMKIKSYYRLYSPELKKTIQFAVPIMIAQLGVVLMGVIDVFMVRDLGVVATAAAGATNDVFFLLMMFSIGGLNIIAPLVSQAFQKKDLGKCKQTLYSGGVLGIILGVVTTLLLVGVTYYFELLRQTPEVTIQSKGFLTIINWSVFPILLFLAAKQFTDGLSKTKVSMVLTWIGLGFNVLLNWLLIHGNLGFPAMGLAGSALATTLSRFLMMFLMIGYIFWNKQTREILYTKTEHLIDWKSVAKVFRLGLPVGLTYFMEIATFSIAGLLIGSIDYFSQAAHRVVITLVSTTYMMTSGIGIASAIRIGQYYGEKNFAKIRRIGTGALLSAVFIMGAFCILFLAIPEFFVMNLIEDDVKAVPIAISLLVIAGFFQISDGVQAVGLGILRGMEDVNVATFIAFVAYWLIALPLSWLAYKQDWGALGIWIALLIGLSISATMLTVRFFYLLKSKQTSKR